MYIQTEQTPNPATQKFLPGRTVLDHGTADFPNADSAARSPLAKRLFEVDGVAGVFLGSDFVTVTKSAETDWLMLKPLVLHALMDHFVSGAPAVEEADAAGRAAQASEEDDEIVAQIKELIETRVRPAVAADGGDITFQGFENGVVYLNMRGSCSGCPSSTLTLKAGIENMLRHYIPEVVEVRPVL
jgi:Fe-S cluster biogenesis protein NfuA